MNIIKLKIPEYVFVGNHNPYAFDSVDRKSILPISKQIEKAIVSNFDTSNVLVRGIQSGYYKLTKQQLIDKIIEDGQDVYDSDNDVVGVIHAAPFENDVVDKIMTGFHVYKPKCEESPQFPVDVWMVFDKEAYENIKYMHPRHHVLVKDRWKLKSSKTGLLGVLVIE